MSAIPAPRRSVFPLLLFSATFLVALGLVTVFVVRPMLPSAGSSGPPELPRLGPAPAFALAAHDGRTLTEHDLRGYVWVADFVFLRCGSTCPVMTAAMSGLEKALRDVPKVRLVSFDVDPEHDTVADLAAYAKEHGAAAPRWTFVRAQARAEIRAVSVDGFHLALESGSPEDAEPILHSTRFVLVDDAGAIRGSYDGTDPAAVEPLAHDVRLLARGGA